MKLSLSDELDICKVLLQHVAGKLTSLDAGYENTAGNITRLAEFLELSAAMERERNAA